MKFVRSTHINGEFRKELADAQTPNEYGFVMHMLHPERAMTFDEVVCECQKYNADNDESLITEAEVALELIRCVEATCARVIPPLPEIPDGTAPDQPPAV
jgi:hypothetical protein